jgi:hypothetical protein
VVAAAQGFFFQHRRGVPSERALEQPGAEDLEKGLDVGRWEPVKEVVLFFSFSSCFSLRLPRVAALVKGKEGKRREESGPTN